MKAFFFALVLASTAGFAQSGRSLLSESQAPVKDRLNNQGAYYPSSTTLPVGDGSASVGVSRTREDGIVGFNFRSRGMSGGERIYNFEFPERALQGIRLRITDDAQLAGAGLSANLLETSIYFFPRRVIPSVTAENGVLIATLPTGETMQLDTDTGRVSGTLAESAPQDLSPNRHARRFAGLNYSGNGVMIRMDRRAGIPEEEYNVAFNSNEDIKNATVTYRGRSCKVRKKDLFQQGETTNSYPSFADDAALFELLRARCGWNDLPSVDLAVLENFPGAAEVVRATASCK